jgi:hypothetical protein
MTNRIRTALMASTLACAAFKLYAGGPLSVHKGVPVRYRTTQPVVYHLDKGPMGGFSSAVAQNIAAASFQVWQDVPTAVITFKRDSLSVDVTAANYASYVGNFSDGLNPIIFDHDGSIIDAIVGEGASSNVIGFAGSSYALSGPNEGFFVEGHAVMNGTMAGTVFTEAEFTSTFVHEFGHFIGLDHTQVNATLAGNGNAADDVYLPTMYPTSSDDDTQLATLNPDDIVSVSRLYPDASFASTTGTISGSVTRSDLSPVRGAVVVAINIADSLMGQYSTVTDYLQQGTGNYAISGLPPGTYWVKIEPVRTSFTGGSSVGPYADDLSGLSFITPVSPEYFNGAGESGDPLSDTSSARVGVSVSAGASTTASLVANNAAPPGDAAVLQYHGALAYVFRLPSEYDDLKYAVRFTPGRTAPLLKVDFRLNGAPVAVQGNGSLKVSVFSDKPGSLGGIPNIQQGPSVLVPFSSLTTGVFNEVDLTSLGLMMTNGVNFHVVFEVVGTAGDTLQFVADDGANPTSRSSSYYDAGSGLQWYNFEDPNNWGAGYNLAVRAYLGDAVLGAGSSDLLTPDRIQLLQNYPNPFNPTTVIPFRLARSGVVTLDVRDMLGRKVATIVEQREFQAGDHQAVFDGFGLPSGTYFARLVVDGQARVVRMVLLR